MSDYEDKKSPSPTRPWEEISTSARPTDELRDKSKFPSIPHALRNSTGFPGKIKEFLE